MNTSTQKISVILDATTVSVERLAQMSESIREVLGHEVQFCAAVFPGQTEAIVADKRTSGVDLAVVPQNVASSSGERLNAAAAESVGDVLVFCQGPVWLEGGNWAATLKSLPQDCSLAVAWTESLLPTVAGSVQERRHAVARNRGIWDYGVTLACHRSHFLALRGFDEISQVGLEVLDFCVRLGRIGVRTIDYGSGDLAAHLVVPQNETDTPEPMFSPKEREQHRQLVAADKTYYRNTKKWRYRPADAPPLITVAIATRDRAEYLRDSIQSVLWQTIQDFELIIVDDGSEDNTEEVVRSFTDDRIRYIKQGKRGIAAARNVIADNSAGILTAVHDDDDIMLPWRLETGLSFLTEGVTATYGSWVNFDNVTADMVLHVIKEQFCMAVSQTTGQTPGHATWLVPTRIIRSLRYDETLSSAVDHNLALRIMKSGYRWAHTGKVLFLRRMHPMQVSVADVARQKYAAGLSKFMLRGTLSIADSERQLEASKAIRWPRIAEKDDLQKAFVKFLPDHLVVRRATLQGSVINKALAISRLNSSTYISAETNEDGKYVAEHLEIRNISIADMTLMAEAGISAEIYAELNLGQEIIHESDPEVLTRALNERIDAIGRKLTKSGLKPVLLVLESSTETEGILAGLEQPVITKRRLTCVVSEAFRKTVIVLAFRDAITARAAASVLSTTSEYGVAVLLPRPAASSETDLLVTAIREFETTK